MPDPRRYSVDPDTGYDEISFYDENDVKYAVVSRRKVIAHGGPMRVYQCLHLCPTENDDYMLVSAALSMLKHHDEEMEAAP